MKFADSEKKPCQHEGYCDFSKSICLTTDFQQRCHMMDASIDEMHLLGVVKNRVEREHQWELDHEQEMKEHAKALEELAKLRKD